MKRFVLFFFFTSLLVNVFAQPLPNLVKRTMRYGLRASDFDKGDDYFITLDTFDNTHSKEYYTDYRTYDKVKEVIAAVNDALAIYQGEPLCWFNHLVDHP